MASYDSLLKELNVQEEIEGRSDNIDLCRLIVKHLKTNADIRAFFNIKMQRYGKLSYEVHKFYYVKDNIKSLFNEVTAKNM